MAQVVDGRSLEYTKILQYIIITHMAQVVDGRLFPLGPRKPHISSLDDDVMT